MRIDLRNISQEPRLYRFELHPDWWKKQEPHGQILGLDGPLTVRISLAREGDHFILEGEIAGLLEMMCDRCLGSFAQRLESDFTTTLFLSPPGTDLDEVELLGDDLSVDFISTDEIDLEDFVKEQIYLSLPMKALCRHDCLGVCATCGKNLNFETCECRPDRGHPGFSKLKNLSIKGEQL